MGTSASLKGGGADEELADGSSVEDELGPDLLSLLQNGIAMERQRRGRNLVSVERSVEWPNISCFLASQFSESHG
jgi:hypothetical protein